MRRFFYFLIFCFALYFLFFSRDSFASDSFSDCRNVRVAKASCESSYEAKEWARKAAEYAANLRSPPLIVCPYVLSGKFYSYSISNPGQCDVSSGGSFERFFSFVGSPSDCSNKPSLGFASLDIDGSGAACYQGCSYRSSGSAVTVTMVNGSRYRNASQWEPTGSVCATSTDDNDSADIGSDGNCKTVGSNGSQHCINQNGEQCIKFASGGEYCWQSEFEGLEIIKNGEQWVQKESGNVNINPPSNANNPTKEGEIKTENSSGQVSTIGWGATGGMKDSAGNGSGNSGGNGNTGNGNGNGNGDGDGDGDGISAGGGSNCGDPPTCSGDAATCAVYRQVWLQRCDGHGEFDGNAGGDFDLPGDIDAALNDEGDGSWRSADDETLERKEINGDVLLSKLDSSGFLGGGTCPPPVNISIGGKASMTFSFSAICEMLASASYLVMMLAYYLAIRIITKTK